MVIVKRTYCRYVKKGCQRGALCAFAHGKNEIGQTVKKVHGQKQLSHNLLLCKNWLPGGKKDCQYGSGCRYAHGEEEQLANVKKEKANPQDRWPYSRYRTSAYSYIDCEIHIHPYQQNSNTHYHASTLLIC